MRQLCSRMNGVQDACFSSRVNAFLFCSACARVNALLRIPFPLPRNPHKQTNTHTHTHTDTHTHTQLSMDAQLSIDAQLSMDGHTYSPRALNTHYRYAQERISRKLSSWIHASIKTYDKFGAVQREWREFFLRHSGGPPSA